MFKKKQVFAFVLCAHVCGFVQSQPQGLDEKELDRLRPILEELNGDQGPYYGDTDLNLVKEQEEALLKELNEEYEQLIEARGQVPLHSDSSIATPPPFPTFVQCDIRVTTQHTTVCPYIGGGMAYDPFNQRETYRQGSPIVTTFRTPHGKNYTVVGRYAAGGGLEPLPSAMELSNYSPSGNPNQCSTNSFFEMATTTFWGVINGRLTSRQVDFLAEYSLQFNRPEPTSEVKGVQTLSCRLAHL